MKVFKKVATAGAVAAVGLGLGTATASAAYSISGGSFTSTPSATHRYTNGGSYTISCASTVFTGVAAGADSVDATPAFSGCRFMGFVSTVTQSGPWNFAVTGDNGAGTYTFSLSIPAGTTTTYTVPVMGCSFTVAGPQTFAHGVGGNVVSATNWASGPGVDLTAVFSNIAYTSSGSCPWGLGTLSNGTYTTAGATSFPGLAIAGP